MPPKGSGKGKKSKKGSVTPPTQSTSSQPTVTPTKRPSPTVSVSGGSIAGSPKKARLEPNTFRPGTRRPAQDLNASRFGEVPAGGELGRLMACCEYFESHFCDCSARHSTGAA